MSNQQQNNVPRKGDIIINPSTQRPVKVGSRTWLNLVKKGLVEGRYQDPNELYEVKEEENQPEILEKKIEEINKTLPRGTQAVRGRGKYAGKIVKRQKQPSTKELTEYTAKTAARTVKKNIADLEDMSYEDMERELEQLILSELTSGQSQLQPQPKRRGRPKKQTVDEEQYYTQQPDEYDPLLPDEDEDEAEDENYYDPNYL